MIGRFDYYKNCSLIHHVPQGETYQGLPVIVFPRNAMSVVAGHTYEFAMRISSGTYTIDKKEYRVAHATILRETEGKEGGIIDQILHSHKMGQTLKTKSTGSTLGDRLDPETRAKLEAMRRAS